MTVQAKMLFRATASSSSAFSKHSNIIVAASARSFSTAADDAGMTAADAASAPSGGMLKKPKEIDPEDARRKGLAWRAKQRGWLELDWLVGTFAEKHLANLEEKELEQFEELLEADNPDLFNYLSSQEPAPAKFLENDVYMMM